MASFSRSRSSGSETDESTDEHVMSIDDLLQTTINDSDDGQSSTVEHADNLAADFRAQDSDIYESETDDPAALTQERDHQGTSDAVATHEREAGIVREREAAAAREREAAAAAVREQEAVAAREREAAAAVRERDIAIVREQEAAAVREREAAAAAVLREWEAAAAREREQNAATQEREAVAAPPARERDTAAAQLQEEPEAIIRKPQKRTLCLTTPDPESDLSSVEDRPPPQLVRTNQANRGSGRRPPPQKKRKKR